MNCASDHLATVGTCKVDPRRVKAKEKTLCATRWATLDPAKWEGAVNEMQVDWKQPLQFLEALGAVAAQHRTRRQQNVDPLLEDLGALFLGETVMAPITCSAYPVSLPVEGIASQRKTVFTFQLARGLQQGTPSRVHSKDRRRHLRNP